MMTKRQFLITDAVAVPMGKAMVGYRFTNINCVYLAVPATHPWYGVDHDTLVMEWDLPMGVDLSFSEEAGKLFLLLGISEPLWVVGMSAHHMDSHESFMENYEAMIGAACNDAALRDM